MYAANQFHLGRDKIRNVPYRHPSTSENVSRMPINGVAQNRGTHSTRTSETPTAMKFRFPEPHGADRQGSVGPEIQWAIETPAESNRKLDACEGGGSGSYHRVHCDHRESVVFRGPTTVHIHLGSNGQTPS
jgi:hypothetical protein